MSYYADGYGYLKVKKNLYVSVKELNEVCKELWISDGGDNSICVEFEGNYYEDGIYDDLEILREYFEGGYIDFRGEDYTFWRFKLEDGSWVEYGGEIVYSKVGSKVSKNQ